MLREAIEYLFDKGKETCGGLIEENGKEPSHVYFIQRPDGTLERHEAEPKPRDHKILSLEDFVSYCITCKGSDGGTAPVIWYNREKVVAVLDDETRRDVVTLPLKMAQQIGTLNILEKNKQSLEQKDMLKVLRIDFKGCLTQHPTLVETMRSVKFRFDQEGSSEIRNQKSSVGKRLESELLCTATLPEDVCIAVSVFPGILPMAFNIMCALEVHTAEQRFQLIPYPGAIEQAIMEAECALGDKLKTDLTGHEDIHLFYGNP